MNERIKDKTNAVMLLQRLTVSDQCFGTVGLSYNRFRNDTASAKLFRQFVIDFFSGLQTMADQL